MIAAPPERVYAALVDPDALKAWLAPDGMSGRFDRFDARPGGSYRLILTYARTKPISAGIDRRFSVGSWGRDAREASARV